MTNPDNVGGLLNSAFEKLMRRMHKHGDSDERYIWDEAVRISGELCRAAPAGGVCDKLRPGAPCQSPDSCRENGCAAVERELFAHAGGDAEVVRLRQLLAGTQEQFRVVSELLERNQAHHERMMKLMDSAPAGSGEVDALVDELILAARANARSASSQGFEMTEAIHLSYEVNFRQIRALLRKLQQGADGGHPLWLLYMGDQFINSRKRLPGEGDDAGLKGFLRGAVRSLKEAKRQGYRVVRGFAVQAWPEAAQRRWEFVRARGKLPVRCSAGYYYEDGVIYPSPESAIDAAIAASQGQEGGTNG